MSFFESTEDSKLHCIPQDIFNMLGKMFSKQYWTVNDVRKNTERKLET
ncbi:hypothetical protein ACFOEQ_14070 [Chryseobacterium arachidis]